MNRLAGKVALITGAASGIGEGISRAFASEGGLVYVSDLRDDAGQRVADSTQPSARYVHLDVREERDWISAVDSILKECGRLDVVVNNAGITDLKLPMFHMTRRELHLPIRTQRWQQISMGHSLVASTRYERCALAARARSSTCLRVPGSLAFLRLRHTQPVKPRFETTPRP